MTDRYPPELLPEDEDDGTMVENLADFSAAVVGHKIVSVKKEWRPTESYPNPAEKFVITLDNGTEVELTDDGDCCAYTRLKDFLLNVDQIDNIITGVGTTDEYQTWHVYADAGDVLKMTVGWSCGNPFYYGYGFRINVVPVGGGTNE
jgi:hypothetical protein